MSECDITFVGRGWFDPTGAVYALLGWNMAGAGDVNGDGYDDMIVAAPWDDDGGNESGQVYLIFGREGEGGHSKIDLSSAAGASFIGEHSGERLGVGLDGGTDVNGDGYDDMIIGSSTRRNEAGETYLILGQASGWAKGIRVSEANVAFYGEAPEDGSGWAISMGGDVNGDGFSVIFIGAGWNDFNGINSGQAYLQCRQEQKGDVDFDGEINITDVTLAVNILLKLSDEPPGRV